MNKKHSLCALCLLALAGIANAANYTLWINGRNSGGTPGNYGDFRYWGPASTPAGVNKQAVNWDGRSSVASQSGRVRDALDCFCTGQNWCYIAAYSAGELLFGYTLANFGGSTRAIRHTSANAAGVCGDAGGVQTGWNIKWVRTAAGAAGGSELANAGAWATSEPLVQDLKVSTARAMYNHNNTRNIWFYRYAGARGTVYSFLLPGQDDEVVAYHSSGGAAGSAGRSLCNPGDWFCDDLTYGSARNQGGSVKWSWHAVAFRDDGEDIGHYGDANWQGIVGVVREAVAVTAN